MKLTHKKNPNHEAEAAHVMSQASKRRMTHEEYMSEPDSGYSEEDKKAIREGIKKQSLPSPYAKGGEVSCPSCGYAHGGKVVRQESEEGMSYQGKVVRNTPKESDDFLRNRTLREEARREAGWRLNKERSMPKPHGEFAEGGEVEDPGQVEEVDTLENMDDEIQGILGQELMESFEKKDHKGVMKAIEALIRTCLSKE